MDETAKLRVKDALVAHVNAELRTNRLSVTRQDSAAELDPNSSFSVDDQSQSDESGELGALFQGVEDRQKDILARIEDLDFRIKTAVTPGAIVGFGGARYVVGAVASPFEHDGITYQGIPADAPIYATLAGLGVGDTFTFRGREQRIDFLA
jgi:hypothetical protein